MRFWFLLNHRKKVFLFIEVQGVLLPPPPLSGLNTKIHSLCVSSLGVNPKLCFLEKNGTAFFRDVEWN